MKLKTLLLILAMSALSYAQTTSGTPTQVTGLAGNTITVVSQLVNVAKQKGTPAIIIDGNSATDCTTGSGSNVVLCAWNGSAWAALSGGGGGAVSSVFTRTGAVVAANNDYSLDQIASAAATKSLSNAANTQTWNWTLTGQAGLVLGESSAATGTSFIQQIGTTTASTAIPLQINQGSLSAGTGITTNIHGLDLNCTWNAAGIVFDACLFANVTNTASAANSLIIDLQVGSATQFSVTKGGTVALTSISQNAVTGTALGITASNNTGTSNGNTINMSAGNYTGTTASKNGGSINLNAGNITNAAAPSTDTGGQATLAGGGVTVNAAANAGPAVVSGGSTSSTNTASGGGIAELSAGFATGGGQQGLVAVMGSFIKGAGTTTLWGIQCTLATAWNVNDCATSASTGLNAGIAMTTTTPVFVCRAGSICPVNADGAVTLGHTLCVSTTTAGDAHDSAGTTSCAVGQGIGTVIATSGTYLLWNPNTSAAISVTASTTVPIISYQPY